ncbi:DUF4097 family beta strand repeat-containing protein [Jiulongibacter sp. NS-SX5]|uniref:DUF4097 family beta strand repeat-containing protein n=1 Tax=Jiulongibacter sp. NS-SX5 TaxID=3463854 RepID=UPI0040590F28
MKKLILPFILLFFAFQLAAQEPFVVRSFDAGSVKNLDVKTSGGQIVVYGDAEDEARVEVYIKSSRGGELSKREIESRLDDYTLEVGMEGSTLKCFSKKNSRGDYKNGLRISFRVYVPKFTNTDLLTSGGNIKMRNLDGDLKFTTSGGSLDLANLRGEINGRTSGGSIKARNLEDEIDLVTSGGSIDVENLAGDISIHTSGGSIHMYQMYGQINARTSGGGIDITAVEGDLSTSTSGGSIRLKEIAGSVKASTSGGGITADIEEVGDYLILHSSGGGIDVNMPMDKGMDLDIRGNRVSVAGMRSFRGTESKNKVIGKLNGGGVEVNISTSSGTVSIN